MFMPRPPLALYVHWPFCKAKCPYCDFNSHVREQVDDAAWRAALLRELAWCAERLPGRIITSIFFGGGTPSLMPPATVAAIIEAAGKHWPLDAEVEITLEANPTSVEAKKFRGFRAAGVNRVSLGVQALNDADLAFLGRKHGAEEALRAVTLAAEIFPRHSFDLIYARPGQTIESWQKELTHALIYANGHLSLYQLTIEQGTAFHAAYGKGDFVLPEEERTAQLYEQTQAMMDAAGLPAYEISNHARPGEESRHNLTYWRSGEYTGIGPGAHGRIMMEGDVTRSATQAIKSPERWLEAVAREGHGMERIEVLSGYEGWEERVMMRLRLAEPVPFDLWPDRQALQRKIVPLMREGLVEMQDESFRTTLQGRLVLTALTAELTG